MAISALERIKQQREAIKLNRAGQTRAYKFKEGKTVISILPGHADPEEFFRKFGLHYLKNKKDEFVVAVGDRSICFDEPCVVRDGLVDMIRYANSIGDDDLSESAKKSLARPAYLMNIMVHQDPDKKAEEFPQLANFSESLGDQIFSILEEYLAEGADDLLRWKDRLLFVVERTGTGAKDTKYKVYPAAKRMSVDPSVMAKAVNLEEYVKAQFTDSVNKALTYISTATGRPVSGSAFAAALTAPVGGATAALEGPVETATVVPSSDEDLLAEAPAPAAKRVEEAPALAAARTVDAEFEDVTAAAETPTKSDDDLLSEIDALAAA
jgi:hypothetical protein